MEVVDVQKLISEGQLKLLDTFVTDRAFEEFCRKHDSLINMALIDPSTGSGWSVNTEFLIRSKRRRYLVLRSTRSSYEREAVIVAAKKGTTSQDS